MFGTGPIGGGMFGGAGLSDGFSQWSSSPAGQAAMQEAQRRAQLGANYFRSTAPKLNESNYANAITQAQGQAQAANTAATGVGVQQGDLAQALMAQANGQGPSLAQMQLQQATDRNNSMAAGAIASQRGINPALAQRMVMQNQAMANQGAAGQSAMARMQEQMQAREQLAQALNAQRAGDINQAQVSNSMFGTSGQLQNAQNATRSQNSYAGQQLDAGAIGQNAQIQSGQDAADAAFQRQVVGGVMSGAGAALGTMAGGPGLGTSLGASAGNAGAGLMSPTMFARGGMVPGDSPKNDTVPAMLSPGEVVLPRSVVQSGNAPDKARAFVEAIKGKTGGGYETVLAKQKELHDRISALEKLCNGGMVYR